ncbi:MAG: flagellar motor switch protein FliN [Chthonomonas sp.]|nr:flagellar motor switch protein FliN [Chthonomonas sp.]
MPIHQQVLSKLTEIEGTICQSLSTALSDSTGHTITFGNPLSSATTISELESDMNQPWLVVQFAFASSPERTQLFLISQDHFMSLAEKITGTPVTAVEDTVITECRSAIETIVKGLCTATSQEPGEIAINFQILSLPANFGEPAIFRSNIAITGEELSATLVWLMDAETATSITGVEIPSAEGGAITDAGSWAGGATRSDSNSLEILMDIPLEISVELGRMKMPVRDVIDLGAGSIVEIDKAAGEPVDVLVNGRLVAKGEVVVIEDSFGVRITEILSPNERLQRLSEAA